ncbi:MAG: protein translocase subunit SecD [Patescibacteria group bacterium]|nr:protein translocase subunit SecD [Patescibacteria group bacterium]
MQENDHILKKIFHPSARGRLWQIFVIIFILAIVGGLVDAGAYYNRSIDWLADKTGQSIAWLKVSELPFHLGLDLQGGSHLIYEADMSAIEDKDKASALEGVRDVIERRVNVFGVSEPIVQTTISGGEYRVIAELAGVKDINEAITMIGETPLLEFKEQDNQLRKLSEEEKIQMDAYNQEAEARAEEVLGKLLSGGDFGALAKEYSQDEQTKASGGDMGWVTENGYPEIVSYIKNLDKEQIASDLIHSSRGYEILKLEDKREKINPFKDNEIEKEVKASHLLLCYEGIDGCETGLTKEETYARIKQIKTEATPENFSQLVKENSTEPGAANSGGELGWFEKGMMVAPFEDAVFSQAVNTISYVVETQFGYHLIYKQDERPIIEYKAQRILIAIVRDSDIIGEQKEWKNTELTGKNLDRANVQFDPNDNSPVVGLEFDGEGADLFADITERNIGQPVAIYLDGYAVSAPTVNEKITGGRAVISGNFNINEAKLLAQRLNAGALPVPINLINQQTVGASLGKASLSSSLKAGIAGLILVVFFVIIFYRLPGLLAVISLTIYGVLILAVFKVWPITLTLSGMAGFILSIGMAVDANVLIFERLKEELRSGKPLDLAVADSFNRAWPSIRDGNVSTLITCFILIQFSTSVVKGFAVTLGLGILVSMFSAIVITKTFLQLISNSWLENKLWLLGAKRKT